MADLAQLSTSTLLDDLATLRRYRDSICKTQGRATYAARLHALAMEFARRGLALPPDDQPPEPPPAPCRLTPLGDHVVVLPVEAETMTEGGIIVPDSAKEKPREGTVLAVGPGRTEPGIGTLVPAVHVGDTILFGLYSGISVALDGQAVLIMREEDVLGILQQKVSDGEK